MRAAIAILVLLPMVQATVVDGIVATVGRTAITASMVRRSLRASALLGRVPLDESPAVFDVARSRLIEQALVKEEIRISRYPSAQPDEIRAAIEQVKAQFGGADNFTATLRRYRLTEADLAENLGWQITFARFISYRFRPSVQITDEALRNFYATWTPAQGPKPPFEEARERLEADYVAIEAARYLDRWLDETRQQTRIEVFRLHGDER